MSFSLFTIVCLLHVTQASPAPAVLTPEQALSVRQISDLRISPNGSRLALVVSEPPKGTTRAREIWILEVASKTLGRFTFSPKSAFSPRWSPDGRTLAFLSDRDGGQQIHLLPMSGGEATRLTQIKSGVQSFDWSPDGARIAFLAPEPRSDADEKKLAEKDDARVVDRDERHPRVWIVDVGSKQARQLTSAPWRVSAVKWAPQGDRLVVVATDRPAVDQETNQICWVSLSDGAFTPMLAPRGPFGPFIVSPDGAAVAYTGSRVDGPNPHDLYLLTLGEQQPRNLTASSLDRPVGPFVWRPDGSLLAIVQTGFKSALTTISRQGTAQRLAVKLDVNPTALALGSNGLLAFVGETTVEPPEVWLSTGRGTPERATRINEKVKSLPIAGREIYRYKSFDGIEIEASLLKPAGARQGTPLPLAVLIHGGPTGRWADGFEPWGQLLTARGYAVFYPNIRGSVGYGHRFVEMNRADWGGGDFKDVMAGVDDLVRRGIADPERLGIGGWSYGGYMAAWAITQTNRFKASVVGAGLSDLASEFGTEDESAYDEWFFGLPYEKLDGFIKSSPITYIKNARTPTLILHGEADATDPLGQGQQLHRGLKRYGVPTELVIYPREGHGLQEERHLLDRFNRIIAWFDKYVK
jgi:dipeptidyl aminopeptidase/acylaminoacyl peptidase